MARKHMQIYWSPIQLITFGLAIKTSGSESQGQEEAVCTLIFRPMQPP